MAQVARTDIGFRGGQVLSLRVAGDPYGKLVAALRGDQANHWHTLEHEDEQIEIDLSQVIYVRREIDGQKVGF